MLEEIARGKLGVIARGTHWRELQECSARGKLGVIARGTHWRELQECSARGNREDERSRETAEVCSVVSEKVEESKR